MRAVWLCAVAAYLPFPVGTSRSAIPTNFGFPEVFNIELLVFAVLGVVRFCATPVRGRRPRALGEFERASLLGIPVGASR